MRTPDESGVLSWYHATNLDFPCPAIGTMGFRGRVPKFSIFCNFWKFLQIFYFFSNLNHESFVKFHVSSTEEVRTVCDRIAPPLNSVGADYGFKSVEGLPLPNHVRRHETIVIRSPWPERKLVLVTRAMAAKLQPCGVRGSCVGSIRSLF